MSNRTVGVIRITNRDNIIRLSGQRILFENRKERGGSRKEEKEGTERKKQGGRKSEEEGRKGRKRKQRKRKEGAEGRTGGKEGEKEARKKKKGMGEGRREEEEKDLSYLQQWLEAFVANFEKIIAVHSLEPRRKERERKYA
ncbi:hypothetical protein L345_05844, partial [Ophiophagus hannah]